MQNNNSLKSEICSRYNLCSVCYERFFQYTLDNFSQIAGESRDRICRGCFGIFHNGVGMYSIIKEQIADFVTTSDFFVDSVHLNDAFTLTVSNKALKSELIEYDCGFKSVYSVFPSVFSVNPNSRSIDHTSSAHLSLIEPDFNLKDIRIAGRKRSAEDLDNKRKELVLSDISTYMEKVLASSPTDRCDIKLRHHVKPIVFGGQYSKYSRSISQTPYVHGKTTASVSSLIGDCVQGIVDCDKWEFHGSGREDMDVRMLGGRPFYLRVYNPQCIVSSKIEELRDALSSLADGAVVVREFNIEDEEYADLIKEGQDSKRKSYRCLIVCDEAPSQDSINTLNSIDVLEITQGTPIRTLHRRSLLGRKRNIYTPRVEFFQDTKLAIFSLDTDAGTYIKEFVSSDFNRTKPSLSSLLQRKTEIIQLDVAEVKLN
ncbi:hypothetical protein PCE1_004900 [Barthelona sp. PCE]